MKAILEKSDLSRIAGVADLSKGHAIGSFAMVRLTADESSLTVVANDGLVQATLTVDSVGAPGTVCVNGGMFSRAVASLPAGRVELIAEGSRLAIQSGRSRFSLTVAAEDAVGIAPIEASYRCSVQVNGEDLAAVVKQLPPFVKKQALQGVLSGICCVANTDGLTCFATDHHRLGLRRMAGKVTFADRAEPKCEVSLPIQAFQLVAKHAEPNDVVTLELSPERARLSLSRLEVNTRVYSDSPPNFLRLMDSLKEWPHVLVADKAQLVATLSRTALFVEEFTPAKCELGPEIVFSAITSNVAESEQELEGGEYEGDPLTILLNPRYLLDAVKACEGDTVRILVNADTKPVRIEGESEGPYAALINPVRKNV